ncbi:sugar hydrolase [Caulobacter sp. D4A]|uniref:GH92 family glycosyl hydrolase n=1 Tax=unclassified Caulobacter TaxID=2648921 RepID=UPI000D7384E7|nr:MULTISPECIES: GH92 family glycosyl hydrolase [unclassified Caulobacter]PXA87053.1 sugar hydrolase [Caulobacter sp. D5]PXA89608.1 sugar hydrolase [Caulobacter sp. D4A]
MRPGLVLAALVALCAAPALAQAPAQIPWETPYEAVDPFIGTDGEGHTFPGAVAPFGMVQLSPDTDILPFKQSYARAAGYRRSDPTILGFSHTHFSGSGHSDLGDILLAPVSGEARLEPGDPKVPGSGYRSRFTHDGEIAQPGYYAVTLTDSHVRAELTAGTRTGMHRYTFEPGARAQVLLDLRSSIYNYPGKVSWSRIRVRDDGTVTGMRETRGWAPGRQLYFAIRFSRPMVARSLTSTETDVPYKGFKQPGRSGDDRAQLEGRALVGVFDFGQIDGPLVAKVAISTVDEAGALANLDSDEKGFDFDALRARTRADWEKALGALDIAAPAPMRTNVYTALYHALIAPSVSGDVDGRWRGPDNAVHQAEGFTYHSTFSLWDTFRAEHPLLTLVQPEKRNADFVNSLVASQKVSPYGILPVWAFHGQETWTMIGYHAVPVIADAWLKGVHGIDADAALDAMVKSATYGPYGGLSDYMTLGYVPIDREPEAASKTVEYAFDDWTIARMAKALGKADIAATFEKRSLNWRNSFDAKTGFLRARKSDGTFREPFDPTAINYGSDYTEGNAWQYSWFAPHDLGGLVSTMGGDAAVVKKLDAMFEYDNSKLDYSHAEDIAGLIGQYIHGNEPSHHVAYMYAYAGAPWRTQARLKQIVESQYKPTPEGLSGNDDLGQMSAWLVFTALGFYPVAPGSNEYVIGRPFVERAVLTLDGGKRFTVRAQGLSDAHPYVARVTLNGKPLDRVFLRDAEIRAGGELVFTMGATPNKAWGVKVDARPYSLTPYPK